MKTAVITGGNGGLGRALAKGIQSWGWHTVLMDIDIAGIENTANQTAICVDLTNADELAKASSDILNSRPSIDLVIYNAGVTHIGAFSETSGETHQKVFDINYFSAVNLARYFIVALRASKGTHLAITSVAGFSPLYHRTAYAASKHAMTGFFSSLRSEESPFGVRTAVAAPSFVATNIGDVSPTKDGTARPGSATDGVDYMTPEDAASCILKGLRKKRDFIAVGRVARLAWIMSRFSPSLFQRLMERRIRGS